MVVTVTTLEVEKDGSLVKKGRVDSKGEKSYTVVTGGLTSLILGTSTMTKKRKGTSDVG